MGPLLGMTGDYRQQTATTFIAKQSLEKTMISPKKCSKAKITDQY